MTDTTKSRNVYFTCTLGSTAYAIDVGSVKEVIPFERITSVPCAAPYMKGVMNIRGTVISVIDFRILFGIPETEWTENPSIIVSEVHSGEDNQLTFGFTADSVAGVSELDDEQPHNTSASDLTSGTNKFVKKLARSDGKFVLILDLDAVLEHVESDLETLTKTR